MSSQDFRFSNLLGAPYRGGTLLLHGNTLLSPVGNRVTQARARVLRFAPPRPQPPRRLGIASRRARAPPRRSDAPVARHAAGGLDRCGEHDAAV